MTGRKIQEMVRALTLGSAPEQVAGAGGKSVSERNRSRRIHAAEIAAEREALRKAGRIR